MADLARTTCTGCHHVSVSPTGCAKCHHPDRWKGELFPLPRPRIIQERWLDRDPAPRWCPLKKALAG